MLFIVSLLGCATDQAGNSPLIRAAFYGDAPKVAALLKAGADVNAANHMGETALLTSAWGGTGRGDVSIAKALIASGANVNASDVLGVTPLMAVSAFGNVEFALVLLDAGADVNAQDVHGYTALHIAALHGHTAIVRALLTRGAKPNVADPRGVTPLMLACDCQWPEGVCSGRAEIVRLLIANGADVHMK
ncbi:MAG TPA: ankyrin repeat domain-containing protein, partial [Syntrophorhabdales bacterium]|nr:ankyrin repeat domain-containing protein [Syntrophorhabdales bacterium]